MAPEAARPSLRRRLLLRLAGPVAVLFVLSGGGAYAVALHYANEVYDGWLYDSVSSLAAAVEKTPQGVALQLPDPSRRLFEWDVADTTYFSVRGARSGRIASSAALPPAPADARPYRNAALFDGTLRGQEFRIAVLNLPASDFGEAVQVEVAETVNKRQTLARDIALSVLPFQLLIVLVAVLLMNRGIREAAGSLRAVAHRLSQQTHQSMEPVDSADVPDEVRPLTEALDDLMLRLRGALSAQRKFVADAAHQLRTPLTALKLHIEQALQEPTLEATRAELQRMRASADRTARLSNQLLSLARAEPGGTERPAFQPLDLRALAHEVGSDWVPRALAKRIELSFIAPEAPVSVNGEPVLLREALNNLVDNAVKYAPAGGQVNLRLVDGDPAQLIVEDDGPGIPPQERAQAFLRFHRGDRNATEGSGLGLSIVQEIVLRHGGQVALGEGIDGGGLAVTISLPKQAPAGVQAPAARRW